jgi:hypothetical protein
MEFKRQSLLANGFQGFVTIRDLRNGQITEVPIVGGVYVVLRELDSNPVFLQANPGYRFKGKDPTLSKSELLANWVEGSHVIYIGKGDKLQRRMKEFMDFGAGKPIGHLGGRLVWQVKNAADFVMAWKPAIPGQAAKVLESQLLVEFNATYGRLPFANLRF